MAGEISPSWDRLLQAAANQERRLDEVDSLERAARLCMRDPMAGLDAIDAITDRTGRYEFLRSALIGYAGASIRAAKEREADVKGRFLQALDVYLPGATVIEPTECIRGHRPDAWLCLDGREVPVEIKRGAFDGKAVLQLVRYMRVYDCEHGVAVAPSLAVPLPSNILFVEVRSWA